MAFLLPSLTCTTAIVVPVNSAPVPRRHPAESSGSRVGALAWTGATGPLALEVVWSRLLRLVFGPTTLAVSTILVAYMLGLGLGQGSGSGEQCWRR